MLTTSERSAPSTLVASPVGLAERHVPPLARRDLSDYEQDYTRPLLFGYVRRELLIADGDVTEIEQRMSRVRGDEGFAMGFAPGCCCSTHLDLAGPGIPCLAAPSSRDDSGPAAQSVPVCGFSTAPLAAGDRDSKDRLARCGEQTPASRRPFHLRDSTGESGAIVALDRAA